MNLAELITSHKDGRSFADLERDCGGTPRAARLQQMTTQPLKNFPDPPTIRAIAAGLRVPEVTVVLASADSLGLDARRAAPAFLDRLPGGVDKLTDRQISTVVALIKELVEANESAAFADTLTQIFSQNSEGIVVTDRDGSVIDGQRREEALKQLTRDLAAPNSKTLEALVEIVNKKAGTGSGKPAKKSVSEPGETPKRSDYDTAARSGPPPSRSDPNRRSDVGEESQDPDDHR